MAPGQRSYALLTALYCATNYLCRSGAAVKYLSHIRSFQVCWLTVPSHSQAVEKLFFVTRLD